MRAAQFRLALLPLAILCIVVATMVPIEWRARVGWDGDGNVDDFARNLLLFAPLGAALWRQRWWVIAAVAGGLSAVAEVLQMWEVARFPSPYDWASNVLGALLGALLVRRIGGAEPVLTIAVNGWRLIGVSLIAMGVIALWQWPRPSPSLTSWDAEYSLLLGNESTRDRPWEGTLADLTLLERAVSAAEVRRLGREPLDALIRDGSQVIYADASRVQLTGQARELPAEVARRMVDRVARSNAFTVMARITVVDLKQQGPARIISFSRDTLARNFDVGQHYDRITFRVRNAVSGPNGQDHRVQTPPVLRPGIETLLVATYDGAVARIYVDGVMVARTNFAALACPVSAFCDAALPLVWWLIGVIAAVLALALMLAVRSSRQSNVMIAAVCLAAAIAVELIVPPIVGSQAWHRYLAWVGALTVTLAVSRGAKGSVVRDCGNGESGSRS